MKFKANDCLELMPQPRKPAEVEWLRSLSSDSTAGDFAISLSDNSRDDEPIVYYCNEIGKWRAGRYIGEISNGKYSISIAPRMEIDTIRHWLRGVATIKPVEQSLGHNADRSFVPELVAVVWATKLRQAARHGLPYLNKKVKEHGLTLKGRLNVASTIPMFAAGKMQLAYDKNIKSLNHPVSRAVVAAYRVLDQMLVGASHWLPTKTDDLVSQLAAEVGNNPRVPSDIELQQVKYTPLTHKFKSVA